MNYIIKRRFCSWFLHQNISNDGENFYNLMIEIMEKISDANENFKENIYLKKFNKKYWINRGKRRRRRRRKKENDLDEKKVRP